MLAEFMLQNALEIENKLVHGFQVSKLVDKINTSGGTEFLSEKVKK